LQNSGEYFATFLLFMIAHEAILAEFVNNWRVLNRNTNTKEDMSYSI
jgi:hypothetical protein